MVFFIFLFFIFWGNGVFAANDCEEYIVDRTRGILTKLPASPNLTWACSVGTDSTNVFEGYCYYGQWTSINSCSGSCSGGRCADSTDTGGDTPETNKDCDSTTTRDGRVNISFPSMSHGESVCVTVGDRIWSGTCNNGNTVTVPCQSICQNGICDDYISAPDGGDDSSSSPGTDSGTTPGSGGSPPQLEGVFQVIYNGVKFFFGFIAIVAAAMVVYGAYMWMASGGDPQKTKMAQGVLTWAVIGLIFFMTFWFFFDFILGLFGIQLPTPSGTGLF